MVIEPSHHEPGDGHLGVLTWRWGHGVMALSSAPVGGGLRRIDWLANIGVPLRYDRTDLGAHATEIASGLGLDGAGAAMFTAAEVGDGQRSICEGVAVDATVGISKPTWAADTTGGYSRWQPGTINVVVQLPVMLEVSAAVNAVMTATEAKTQALHEAGVPGTGTASDAVVITWPAASTGRAEAFAGPRSAWGARVARAVHGAVGVGIDRWRS